MTEAIRLAIAVAMGLTTGRAVSLAIAQAH
jgi:hypothetical protein